MKSLIFVQSMKIEACIIHDMYLLPLSQMGSIEPVLWVEVFNSFCTGTPQSAIPLMSWSSSLGQSLRNVF